MLKLGSFLLAPLVLQEREISPEEILFEVQKRLAFLRDKNLPRQSPLGILAESNLNTVFWMYAAFLSGRIFTPLPSPLTQAEEDQYLSLLPSPFFLVRGNEELSASHKEDLPLVPCQGDELMTYIFSSGSTSTPKRIALSFNNFYSQAKAHEKHNHQDPNDCWLASLPLFHVGGVNIFTRGLFLGQKIAFDGKFTLEKYSSWLSGGKISALSIVPTMLYRLLNQENKALSPRVKLILVGGAALDENIRIKAKEENWPIELSYGMTETCSQIYTGKTFLPGVKAKLSPSNEILVSCPMLSPEVPRDEEGFYATGDLGEIDNQGRLHILGRIQTLINSGGQKISPEEIEQTLLKHPSVLEAAAFGKKDEHWGEKLALAYVLQKDDETQAEELLAFLRKTLSSKKIPKEMFRVKALPRTSNGKIARKELTRLQEHDEGNR